MPSIVHRASWADHTVVWRELTWEEFRVIKGLPGHSFVRYAAVYQTALISGPDLSSVPAGIVHYVGETELNNNPFSGGYKQILKCLKRSRSWAEGYLQNAQAMICLVFHYRPEELEKWDSTTFFNRLAQAESVLKTKLDPANPDEAPPPTPKRNKRGR